MDEQARKRSREIEHKLIVAKAWRRSGQFEKALNRGQSILEEAQKLKHPQLIVGANLVIGRTLIDLGHFEEASQALENAYFDADVCGDDLRALNAANHLIFTVGDRLADHKTGERWYWLATIKRKRLGLDRNHPEVAYSLHNMGIVQFCQGRYQKALSAYQQALDIRNKILGPNHPDLAASYNNMGIVYRRQGKYSQALQAYTKTLSIEEKALGPKHPNVGGTLNNMGIVYYVQGKYNQAMQVFQKAIALREKSLGHDHPYLASSLNNLGTIYRHQKRFNVAKAAMQRALSIREKTFGTYHPKVADVMSNMGSSYLEQADYAQALRHYQKSLMIREKVLGGGHPALASSLVGLGTLSLKQGKHSQAQAYFERLVAICEKNTCGADSYGSALFALAQIYLDKHNNKKRAWDLATQAKQQCQKMPLLKGQLNEVNRWLEGQKKKMASDAN